MIESATAFQNRWSLIKSRDTFHGIALLIIKLYLNVGKHFQALDIDIEIDFNRSYVTQLCKSG